jgi:hypothetical protein
VLYFMSGAEPDSLSGAGFAYLLFVGPGLVFALVDWLVAKSPVPVIGTTIVGFWALVLAALLLWDRGFDRETMTFGLVGAIPAAVCSWLSMKSQQDRTK